MQAVLVGFDFNFSYMKMMKAATYILKRDCVFVGTNWDAIMPMQSDCSIVIPGRQSVCAFASVCACACACASCVCRQHEMSLLHINDVEINDVRVCRRWW